MRNHMVIWLMLVGLLVQYPVNLPDSYKDNNIATTTSETFFEGENFSQSSLASAQSCECKGYKRQYRWYFGQHAGLSFLNDNVNFLPGNQLNSVEASAVLSDVEGDLLLYSNGLEVRNGSHQLVVDIVNLLGTGFPNSNISISSMGVVLLPHPGNEDLVYLFGVAPFSSLPLLQQLFYAVIDLTANGGIGAAVGTSMPLGVGFTEKILPICKSDGTGYWILTSKTDPPSTNGQHYAYQLTATGLTTTPVISNLGLPVPQSPYGANNTMAASLAGDKVALIISEQPPFGSVTQIIQVFDFNQNTGALSNSINLTPGSNPGGSAQNILRSVIFSPNGRFLYAVDGPTGSTRLVQFDLLAGNVVTTNASQTTIAPMFTGDIFGAMQNGPDGRIYISRRPLDNIVINSIAAINNPNIKGVSCNLDMNFLTFPPSIQGKVGLPNFPVQWNNYNRAEFTYQDTCIGDFTQFYLVDSTSFQTGWSVTWNFNDTAGTTFSSGLANSNFTPQHQFSSAGEQTVTAIVNYGFNCSADTFTYTLNILELPEFDLGNDTTLCHGTTLTLSAPQGYFYSWFYENSLVGSNTQTHLVTSPGNYSVILSNPANLSCNTTESIQVSYYPEYISAFTQEICFGESFVFGNSTFINSVSQPTQSNHTHVFTNQNGCDSTVTMTLIQHPEAMNVVTQTICYNESVTFNNETYNTTGFFPDTIFGGAHNGCDSIIHLNLTVLNQPLLNVTDTVCFGGTAFYAGQPFSTTGNHQLVLPGAGYFGCDSTFNLSLTVLPQSIFQVDTTICSGETVQFGGNLYGASGFYPITDSNAGFWGCDSIIELNLTVLDEARYILNDTICFGDSYLLAGQLYDQTGMYMDTLYGQATSGCDSILEFHLFVYDEAFYSLDTTICFGTTIQLGGTTYNATGMYMDTLPGTAHTGCDSIISLNLSFYDEIILDIGPDISICEGNTYSFGTTLPGFYLWSTGETTPFIAPGVSGVYELTYTSPAGCIVTASAELTVNPLPEPEILGPTTICPGTSAEISVQDTFSSYLWSTGDTTASVIIATAGSYSLIVTNSFGCAQTAITNITEHSQPHVSISLEDTIQICSGESIELQVPSNFSNYLWSNGDTTASINVSSAGTYSVSVLDANGCEATDSIFIQLLTVPDIVFMDTSLCFGNSLLLDTFELTAPGNYTLNMLATNGCDSIVVVDFDWYPVFEDSFYHSICLGDSIFLEGNWYGESGTYSFLYQSADGCDSLVVRHLDVFPSYNQTISMQPCAGDTVFIGGLAISQDTAFTGFYQTASDCDSIVNYQISFVESILETVDVFICPGDSVFVAGDWQFTEDVYVDTFPSIFGCDSIVSNVLYWLPVYEVQDTMVACQGDSFYLEGVWQFSSGDFTDIYTSAVGCDSTVYTHLIIHPTYQDTLADLQFCAGDSVAVNGIWYYSAGWQVQNLNSQFGCDSLVSFLIHELPVYHDTFEIVACAGDVVGLHGQSFDSDTLAFFPFQSVAGCDSLVWYQIQFNPEHFVQQDITICTGDSIFLAGTYQTQEGIYFDTLQNQFNCDSVVETTLNFLDVILTTTTIDLCIGNSVMVHGQMEDAGGIYVQTFVSQTGCDSISTVIITERPHFNHTLDIEICASESVVIHGNLENTSGVYTGSFNSIYGCDSVSVVNLTVLPQNFSEHFYNSCSGIPIDFEGFPVESDTIITISTFDGGGCDSLAIHHFTFYPVYSDTTLMSICEGDAVEIAGQWTTNSGVYYDSLTTLQGCDSVLVYMLEVIPPVYAWQSFEVCSNVSLLLNGEYWQPGDTMFESFTAISGCDSIVVSTFQPLPIYADTFSHLICEGDVFDWYGTEYTQTGIYEHYLQSQGLCDSLQVLNLQVQLPDSMFIDTMLTIGSQFAGQTIMTDTSIIFVGPGNPCPFYTVYLIAATELFYEYDTIHLCQGEIYDGVPIFVNTTFYDTLLAISGIDSVVQITHVIAGIPLEQDSLFFNVCYGDMLFGQPVLSDFIISDTFQAYNTCDSIVVNVVNVLIPDTVNTYHELCPGDELLGFNWFADTVLQYIYTANNGCDSVHYYNIQVNPVHHFYDTLQLCSGELFLNVPWYADADTSLYFLNQFGCDSIHSYHVQVFLQDTVYMNASVCTGSDFMNTPVFSDTLFTEQHVNQFGCDSVTFWQVQALDILTDTIYGTVCSGDVFESVMIESDTSWTILNTSSIGCDSFTTFMVDVWPDVDTTVIDVSVCYGDEYDGNVYFLDSTWHVLLVNANGCDSVVMTAVAVLPVFESESFWSFCPGDSLFGQVFTQADTLTQFLTAINGCDSIAIHYISIFDVFDETLAFEACPGSVVEGVEVWQDTSWSVMFSTTEGCDSLMTYEVTTWPVFNDTLHWEVCELDFWNNLQIDQDTTIVELLSTNQGCDSTVTHIIQMQPLPTLSLSGLSLICQGDEATWTASGDFAQILWDNGSQQTQVVLSTPGWHGLTVESAFGCTVSDSVFIAWSPDFTIQNAITNDAYSPFSSNGSITLDIDGGTAPITISWSNGQAGTNIDSLMPGIYCATITDDIGCFIEDCFEIESPDTLQIQKVAIDLACYEANNGAVEIVINGGVPPFVYTYVHTTNGTWSGNGNINNEGEPTIISPLIAGTYILQIEDALGILIDTLFVISQPPPLALADAPEIEPISCSGNNTGSVMVEISGGTLPYDVDWNAGNFFLSGVFTQAYNLPEGEVTLTVMDANGCTFTQSFVVPGPTPLILQTETQDADCFEGNNGSAAVFANGGVAPYQYQWNTGHTGSIANGLSAGSYQVTVTDVNGCSAVASVSIGDGNMLQAFVSIVPVTCFMYSDGRIAVDSVSGGVGPYMFAFNNHPVFSDQQVFSGLYAGTYVLTIQDILGCELQVQVSVPQPGEFLINLSAEQDEIGLGDTTFIDLSANMEDFNPVEWMPLSNLQWLDNERLMVYPLQTTTYWIQAENDNGCPSESSITIFVDPKQNIYTPNVFAPDGQPGNNVFVIFAGNEVEMIKKFSVFTRWGEIVHHVKNVPPNDESFGWHGTVYGEPAQVGVYVWFAEILLKNGNTTMIEGQITLLR